MTGPFDDRTNRSTIGVVDTMVTVPSSRDAWKVAFAGLVRDAATSTERHPAGHLFGEVPEVDGTADFIEVLLAEMDRFGIERALLPIAEADEWGCAGVRAHPDRLHGVVLVDPNGGRTSLASLDRLFADGLAVAAAVFPAGTMPQVPLDDALMYPIYARCVEHGIGVVVNVGVPGPRMPTTTQNVARLDQVCVDFPELRLVTRHGGEPWVDLLVELMRRHPNLYYSTSAFAPRHYPRAVVDFAMDDGSHKVLYAGYFPSGLSLERIFAELPALPFDDDVWRRFLRTNAMTVFGLGPDT